LCQENGCSVSEYVSVNFVMSTVWAWCFIPAATREALGPTSPVAAQQRSEPDDPSLETRSATGEDTVSTLPGSASI
jgi:hypothetical protein